MAILIFEKSVEITKRLIGLIEEARTGMEIYYTGSFNEAKTLLQTKEICAALLDLNLNEKECLALIKMAKQIERSNMVVVLYTYAEEKSLKLCKTTGADFLLDKHNDFGQIPNLMNQFLAINNARRNKNTGNDE